MKLQRLSRSIAAALALLALAFPAMAEPQVPDPHPPRSQAPEQPSIRACQPRAEMLDKLRLRFRETPRAVGLSSDGSVVEVTVSETGGWSIIVTQTTGISCLVAVGERWQQIDVASLGDPA